MDKLTYIEVGKEKYPIKCDNLVLQQIQEEFGSVRLFEMALIGLAAEKNPDGTDKRDDKGQIILKHVEPSIKAINFGLPLMVNEGLEIEAGQKNTDFKYLEDKEIIRSIQLSYLKLSEIMHKELARCFETKK